MDDDLIARLVDWDECDEGRINDARQEAAVHMAQAGIPMSEISQFLGHSSTGQTEKVYARFSPGHLRTAADVVDFARVRKAL